MEKNIRDEREEEERGTVGEESEGRLKKEGEGGNIRLLGWGKGKYEDER